VPKAVTITSADDLDTVPDTATITVTSSGLASEDITVNVVDDDANNFIVSRATLSIDEGGSGTFLVALVKAPPATLTATVARTAGDTDIDVTGGAVLTFDAANFGVPQTVTVSAAEDPDTTDDLATISITAAGITTRTVAVIASDNEVEAPLITSTPLTTAVVNAPYGYAVVATGRPAPTFSLTSPPAGMTIGASSGVISWTPAGQGSFPVTVVAANGILPDAMQSFAIAVAPDAAPTCALTRPTQGEIVSGMRAEFFGDGFDDVGTTKAEFFVDGSLRYSPIRTRRGIIISGVRTTSGIRLSSRTAPTRPRWWSATPAGRNVKKRSTSQWPTARMAGLPTHPPNPTALRRRGALPTRPSMPVAARATRSPTRMAG
jgi:hypothetical protein